jgi:hypothetical protein
MNDSANLSIADDTSVTRALAHLEQRVLALESKVAAIPDTKQIEERVTAQVKAKLPPAVDPTQPLSLKDITLPIPDVETIVSTAKTTWAVFEVFGEMKLLVWMLIDRRYHMGWLTRVITIVLVVAILGSHFLWPFARLDSVFSPIWDKLIDLFLGLILFMLLHFEMRRYKEWNSKR